ncbi:MAG TPA: hypothetical protein VGR98_12600 [Streptosporangiaceae bacterium]|nr:hypothetical protein [Streptosporangiaceae bacterium]
MKLSSRAGAAGASICAAVVMLSMAAPAQAAVTGWRQFFRQHYGAPGNFSGYMAVAAPGKSDAWAFGGTALSGGTAPSGSPVAERWNGRAWRGSPLPAGLHDTIIAASAPSATDIWAVTHFGGYVLHWNGTRWSLAKRLPGAVGGQLTGVTALSTDDVWVFGGGGSTGGLGTWHFNGRVWRHWTGNASGLENASAVSPTNIWAIGGLLTPFSAIMHFNGRSWRPVTAKALSGLGFAEIRALTRNDIWATAIAGRSNTPAWLVHFNGTQWTRIRIPWKVVPDRITADGQGGLWLTAVGLTTGQPFVVHRTASGRWSRTPLSTLLFGLALIPGTASLWGVGSATARTGGNAVIWAYGKV